MAKMNLFSYLEENSDSFISEDKASYGGIALKSFILIFVTIAVTSLVALFIPQIIEAGNFEIYLYSAFGAIIIGFFAFLIGRRSAGAAKICGFIYAFAEGLLLGFINCIADLYFPGICGIVLISTMVIFVIVIALYGFHIIVPGKKLMAITIAILIGAFALSIVVIVSSLIHPNLQEYIGLIILGEVLFLLYGCICLVWNLTEASIVVDADLDKSYEWSVALGIMETFIYIYLELLRIAIYILAATKKD